MSVSVNKSWRAAEWFVGTAGNIIYKWWCPECQTDHYGQYCPRDELESAKSANVVADELKHIEVCPHCDRLIKKEVEGC